MLWPELEERVEVYKVKAAAVGPTESDLADFIGEIEGSRPLRRRLAAVIVQIGAKLDHRAVEEVAALTRQPV